jgi:hypothetical protein
MKPNEQIDQFIADLHDWRGDILVSVRKIIHEVDPKILEEWKWKGAPVWSHDGIVMFANAPKDKVKLGFFSGASLPDPDKLFNAELAGNQRRAIQFYKGDTINEHALKLLLQAAIAHNVAKKAAK